MTTEIDWVAQAAAVGVEGFMHPSELAKLVELAEGKDVLEIGSFKGLSAWCMAHTAKWVMCVDTFSAATDGQRQEPQLTTYDAFMRAARQHGNIEHFVSTSREAAYGSPEILERVGGTIGLPSYRRYDLIFLDAMHTYEGVKEDIQLWWPILKDGGVMAFHDYGHDHFPGVKQAVDEVFGELPNREITLGWMVKK